MSDEPAPVFTSFDDAWRWFEAGGALEAIADRRARFTQGRAQFLAFQAALAELPIADAIVEVQDEIADIDGISLFEREALHISLLGIGFQVIEKVRPDDVLREEVARIAAGAASVIRGVRPIEAHIGPVNIFPDAIVLEVRDNGALADLRSRLGALTSGDAFGFAAAEYLPHITIATFSSPDVAPALRERLPHLRERVAGSVTLRRIELARWWFTGVDDAEEPERDVVREYALRG